MVLNLLRVEEINPEYMLERSFYQFQNYAAIPGLHDSMYAVRYLASPPRILCTFIAIRCRYKIAVNLCAWWMDPSIEVRNTGVAINFFLFVNMVWNITEKIVLLC